MITANKMESRISHQHEMTVTIPANKDSATASTNAYIHPLSGELSFDLTEVNITSRDYSN